MSARSIAIALTIAVSSCDVAAPQAGQAETVMTSGMLITARTPEGEIAIHAGEGFVRSYNWGGATRSLKMWPRRKRWYGSLGLYYPGPGDHWKVHDGITRAVVEEGQQHFASLEEASSWLRSRNRGWMAYTYRDDGLVVGWKRVPSRRQLNVEVWQILIQGSRPTRLDGSENGKITVSQRAAP
jgi:hypothetical protein